MSAQLSIFDKYPKRPGYKKRKTSKAAAQKMAARAPTLRDRCLEVLKIWEFTADEIAAAIRSTPFAIRPRISELNKMGLIEDTGILRINGSGVSAIVWRAK